MSTDKHLLPDYENALPGREQSVQLENRHFVTGRPLMAPYPELGEDYQRVVFGLGCFWGAERKFWNVDGVYTTAVGYSAGITPNPSYEDVCTGRTGHNEVVEVIFRPSDISFKQLLAVFFESHNPTQGMRQGNDQGTQYRSGIYCSTESDVEQAKLALAKYQVALDAENHPKITTEVRLAGEFHYAEQYHQQYLAKNPNGYCGIGGTGVTCAI